MMKNLVLFSVLIALSAFLTYGQEVTGEIIGKVTLAEDGTPLPGVTVTLTGQTYGRSDYITTAEGNYRFWKLPPGNYELRFELQGFKPVVRTGIRVNVLRTVTVDQPMEPGGLEEEVTVVGQVPLIDTRKVSAGGAYTSETVEALPVARRTSEIINLAPGVLSAYGQFGTTGSGTFNGFGVRHQVAEYSLDGASYRSTYGNSGMPTGVNTTRVEETQVTTSGQDITNVQGGATVNFVTKRGGNKLAGESYIALIDNALSSKKKLPPSMGPTPANPDPDIDYLGYTSRAGVFRTYDYGASLGGPILKDHLWFFGSWAVVDSQALGYTGDIADRYYAPDMYGKISFQWKKTAAEVSYAHTDYEAKGVDFRPTHITSNKLDRSRPYNTYTASATQTIGSKLLLSGKMTYFSGKRSDGQANIQWTGAGDVSYEDGRTYNPVGRYYTYNNFKSPEWNTETTGQWQHYGEKERRPYWVLEANYFAEGFLGLDQEFKFGVDRNYARFIEEYMLPNQTFSYIYPWWLSTSVEDNAPSPSFGQGNYWGMIRTRCDRYGEKRAERTGVYFQDILQYGRFTANIGMRVDWHAIAWEPVTYHALMPEDDPTITADWAQWTGEMTVQGGRFTVDPTFSPRLSLTYDLTGKGKDILKFMYADYGGMFEGGIKISAGFKQGYLRGEFYMPYIDYNNNYIPDWGTNEIFFKDWFGHWPTPDELQTVAQVSNAEKPGLEAIYGVGKVPWNAWTYPGYFYCRFEGNPLGNKGSASDPTDFAADSYTPEKIREILLSYEKMISTDFSIQLLLAYKKDYNLQWARGYYGSLSNFTLLPGDPYIKVGTDPTTGWDMYQLDPSLPRATGYMYDAYKNTYNYFKGIEFIFTKRFSHGWMLQGSADFQDWKYHADVNEVGHTTLFDYFQDAAFESKQTGQEPRQNVRWHWKVAGLVALPFGINLSGFIDCREGFAYDNWVTSYLGTRLPAKGDKYGDWRYPTFWYANLTLEKMFKFGENITSTVYLTAYNVTDVMVTTWVNNTKVPTNINQITEVNPPRSIQLGIRFNFR
jgi:hypothetical protein